MSLSPSPAPVSATSLFLTPHAPTGAWTSLTFGQTHRGALIEIESLGGAADARVDLLVAVRHAGIMRALPFIEKPARYPGWEVVPADALTRTLSPCQDEFAAPSIGVTLRVLTPQAALPNPKRSSNLQYATAPGILMELLLDNTASAEPAVAFIGIGGLPSGERLRPLDWSSKTLCGVGNGSRWVLAATAAKDEIFTLQASPAALAEKLGHGGGQRKGLIDPTAAAGGIAIIVPAGATKTVPLVFASFLQGLVTQGIEARYFYNTYFPRIEAVANFLLQNAGRVRESCTSFDHRIHGACTHPEKLQLFSRAVRAHNASLQVLDAPATPAAPAGSAHVATIDPKTGQRNALDSLADRLPWELYRNPWVIRNVFDLATTAYAYHDKLRFPGDTETPDEPRPGGMTFARDFGYASAYAPGAPLNSGAMSVSAFDGAGTGPGWSGGQCASEILLNSISMLTSYALLADDTPWAKTRLPFARELLVSLENRDHWDAAKRTGILKAQSMSSATPEQTAFAGLDPLLARAHGSLYLAVKTFCANLLLTTYFQNNNDLHSADYSYAFAQRTAAALAAAFNPETGIFPANLFDGDAAPNAPRMLAALEPLALPTFLGLTTTLPEYFPSIFESLKSHALACLQPAPAGCFDPAANTLRLLSTCDQAHPAKIISILFVLERLFQVDIDAQFPGLWKTLADTLARQSGHSTDALTAALFIKPSA